MKKTEYRKLLKKYSNTEILNMYRDSKIDLDVSEWKDLHRRIEKENMLFHGIEITTIISALLCLAIVIMVAFNIGKTYQEKVATCNKIKGHTCTKYEVEKLGE